MRRYVLVIGILAMLLGWRGAAAQQTAAVDLELVLAVDVSRSMDFEEQALQRAGYVAAFRDPEVIAAIRTAGPRGRIAVAYFEWAGAGLQKVILPWTVVSDRDSAYAVAELLSNTEPVALSRTSISDALRFAHLLFKASGYSSPRRVVDVSGDGPNNAGLPILQVRDRLLDDDIVINGLPIMLKAGRSSGFFDVGELDLYYRDCVIGGFGSFMVPVRKAEEFAPAIRRKLIQEIAGLPPRIVPAQLQRPEGEMDCLIGEKMWENWFGRGQ